jgi:ABC-2 type transport system ATP-binding protein
MLTIEGLNKTYRGAAAPALADVSFAVAKGAFLALLGPNGAGKSTLIHILSGRTDADRGSIRLAGQELRSSSASLRALIGIVPQEMRFDFVFTVEELLRLELGLYGQRRDDAHIHHLLLRLSLDDKRHERVRALSGGMQRRLMIARALVHRPQLLLLDEPSAGVDLHLRRETHDFLRELNAAGTTIVLTTHYLEEAQELCDRVVVLDRGRVVADETRDAFLRMAGDFLTVDVRTAARASRSRLSVPDGALSVARDSQGLRFVLPGSAREALLHALSEAHDAIDSFEIRRPKLEDVFTKLTHREAAAHVHLG